MKYIGEFVDTVRSMPREDVENLVFFLLGVVSTIDEHNNKTGEELLEWCLVYIGYKEA